MANLRAPRRRPETRCATPKKTISRRKVHVQLQRNLVREKIPEGKVQMQLQANELEKTTRSMEGKMDETLRLLRSLAPTLVP